MTDTSRRTPARVIAVQEDFISIRAAAKGGRPLMKNEVVYILPRRKSHGRQERLMAEILRARGEIADAQVFESTRGVGIGDPVEQSGGMLSVSLGPGLLGQVFDGLQSPLNKVADRYGDFLPRGAEEPSLDPQRKWNFSPVVKGGDRMRAGEVLGTVQEGRFSHRIMLPFDLNGEVELVSIHQGAITTEQSVAVIRHGDGLEESIPLVQRWPVRRPLPASLIRSGHNQRLYPDRPMVTTQRIVDTFFPIALGGTACIPGPFGAGKTVLQHLIARHSTVDIVIVIACGERAGEVVEVITELPKLTDPRSGGSLMDRTIIICNTSSMPVAAREASIYTGVTLGEYYRQMGYDVLILADSTSRWAQAMRETSGRLEEIPGEEAFPAYLDSAIKGVYERAGLLQVNDGSVGSMTMVGTVSPAGGNFEEPVTQSTLATVKTFLGLSAERAYKRFYPAIDPLISWSRYPDQLRHWYEEHLADGWTEQVEKMADLLVKGDRIHQMMQVTGEEGISLDDFVVYLKYRLVDDAYLQQDAFDPVDASNTLDRQKRTFALLVHTVEQEPRFDGKEQARDHFTRITGLFRNLNYTAEGTPEYDSTLKKLAAVAPTQP
ncbi:MAG: V-type ATP synthase subunit A [Magnetococcales bacterium]|nr:V-type ATP synthase subunit A [Magnetococcales bacterium]